MSDEAEVHLIVRGGEVVDIIVGEPPEGFLQDGETSEAQRDGAGIGWLRQEDGSYAMPLVDEVAVVKVVSRLELFRRTTDQEAEAIDTALAGQPYRMRQIFASAVTFRSDAEEWAVLKAAAIGLFGPERAAELLAPTG